MNILDAQARIEAERERLEKELYYKEKLLKSLEILMRMKKLISTRYTAQLPKKPSTTTSEQKKIRSVTLGSKI